MIVYRLIIKNKQFICYFLKVLLTFSSNKFIFCCYINLLNKQILKKIYPYCSSFIIGFCGKLYLGWKLCHPIKLIQELSDEFSIKYLKDLDPWSRDLVFYK